MGILLPLALGFVLSVGLAYQTWDAARQHRLTAEATVRDHAAFGAHLIATRLDRRMSQAMIYAFYRVDLEIRGDATRWPAVAPCAPSSPSRRSRALPWTYSSTISTTPSTWRVPTTWDWDPTGTAW